MISAYGAYRIPSGRALFIGRWGVWVLFRADNFMAVKAFNFWSGRQGVYWVLRACGGYRVVRVQGRVFAFLGRAI